MDMLENGINACPQSLWEDQTRNPQYWYVTFHTLFFLDFYCSEKPEGFAPPPPFGLEELDPAGVLPPRVYSKDELITYLNFCRDKCRAMIRGLDDEKANRLTGSLRPGLTYGELSLYSLRHVQHHAAQLNLLLRQNIESAPRWVSQANVPLD